MIWATLAFLLVAGALVAAQQAVRFRLRRRYPGEPWRWRRGWDQGVLRLPGREALLLVLVGMVALAAAAAGFTSSIWREAGPLPALLALTPWLLVLAVGAHTARSLVPLRGWRLSLTDRGRQGRLFRGVVSGELGAGEPRAELVCLRRVAGRRADAGEQVVSRQEAELVPIVPGRELALSVPVGPGPDSGAAHPEGGAVEWRLVVSVGDRQARFEIPVFADEVPSRP